MKVVAIDNDEIFCFLIVELLNKCGVEDVESYLHAEDALFALKKQQNEKALPDLILLDINMPVMDGWDFLTAFGQTHWSKTIPIWVLSSSDYPEDIRRARAYPTVQDVLLKPVSMQTLKEKLQQHMEL